MQSSSNQATNSLDLHLYSGRRTAWIFHPSPENKKFKSERATIEIANKVPMKQIVRNRKISKKRPIKEQKKPKSFIRKSIGINNPHFFDLMNGFENPTDQKKQSSSCEVKPSTKNIGKIREPSITKENSEDENTKHVSILVNHVSMPNIWEL